MNSASRRLAGPSHPHGSRVTNRAARWSGLSQRSDLPEDLISENASVATG
ncbi:hypothetical protein ACF1G0_34550 [Streptomyces sp. NPDC013953]